MLADSNRESTQKLSLALPSVKESSLDGLHLRIDQKTVCRVHGVVDVQRGGTIDRVTSDTVLS